MHLPIHCTGVEWASPVQHWMTLWLGTTDARRWMIRCTAAQLWMTHSTAAVLWMTHSTAAVLWMTDSTAALVWMTDSTAAVLWMTDSTAALVWMTDSTGALLWMTHSTAALLWWILCIGDRPWMIQIGVCLHEISQPVIPCTGDQCMKIRVLPGVLPTWTAHFSTENACTIWTMSLGAALLSGIL